MLMENSDQQFDKVEDALSAAKEKSKKKSPPLSFQLVSLIQESDAILFHDQFGEAYIAIYGDGSRIERLRSRHFRSWLHYHALTLLGRLISSNVVVDAMYTLEGLARHSGALLPLSVRVAVYDNAIWYDLGGSAVKISPDGWDIHERPPILFQRFSHQRLQVFPERGGSLDQLDAVLPSSMKPEHRLLFKVSLVTGLVPHIPQTVDVIFGDHGSAKSTISKVKKALLDPSFIEEFTPPNSLNAFVQLLAHHWYVPLGNLTYMPDWMSDCIARASTGSGFSKRELYSDDDDVIYTFYRIVGLNGINLIAEKADLLDRALLIGDLERIPTNARMEDAVFWRTLEAMKPQVLGAMFEALSGAMRIFHTVKLEHMPQMADFTRWGCAVTQALGMEPSAFLDVYFGNIAGQHDEALEASPIGNVIISFMADKHDWQGTPSELLAALAPIAEALHVHTHKGYPKNPRWVTRRLKEVRVNL